MYIYIIIITAVYIYIYIYIYWPVCENAANKNVHLTVFSRIGKGAGPQADISDEKCKVDIL